jgi:hypothetical protein
MMLGIIMTVLGMILTIYVPIWARSNESTHLKDIEGAFIDLKIAVDTQILTNDVDSKSTTRIPLGASGGPVMGIGRSTGNLDFDSGRATIEVYQTEDPMNIFGEGGGNLIYNSQNYYFIDQTFVYENGGSILIQSGKAVLKATPDLAVEKDPITNITKVELTVISLVGNHKNVGGTDERVVETILTSDMNSPHVFDWYEEGSIYGQNITIKFNTEYPDVWIKYFNESMGSSSNPLIWDQDGSGIIFDGDYYIESAAYAGSDPSLADTTDIFIYIKNLMKLDCEHAVIAVGIN